MSRSGLKYLKRQLGLLFVGALLVLVEAIPAGAAGCHVPDRPILGTRLSWEDDQGVGLSWMMEPHVPPVLTHPPCSGEVPHFLVSITWSIAFAEIAPARSDPSAISGSLSVFDDVGSLCSLGSRLERPPRDRAPRASSV